MLGLRVFITATIIAFVVAVLGKVLEEFFHSPRGALVCAWVTVALVVIAVMGVLAFVWGW
jgi:hypothetical protein